MKNFVKKNCIEKFFDFESIAVFTFSVAVSAVLGFAPFASFLICAFSFALLLFASHTSTYSALFHDGCSIFVKFILFSPFLHRRSSGTRPAHLTALLSSISCRIKCFVINTSN